MAFKRRKIPPSFNMLVCKWILLTHDHMQNSVCCFFSSFRWYLDFLKHVFSQSNSVSGLLVSVVGL